MSEFQGITPGKGIEFTLPSSWYLDDDIFQLEREHIFLKEWYCVGRQEQWPQPGDHKVLDVLGESILLVRNQAGVLRAFYNVCVHRGSRICAADGECETPDRVPLKGGVLGGKVITCPYHAWSYDLDGRLISAPHMSVESGFDSQAIHLHPVLAETYAGFVFVNMTPETAPSFEEHVQGLKKHFSRYPLVDLRIGKTIHCRVDANWKVLCENYNECYHCGHVHPELCKIVPAFKEQGGANLEWERGIAHREGADTFTTTGTTPRRAFPTLNEDEQTRHKGNLLYPNMFLSMAKDHVAAFVLSPQQAGRTLLDCHFLFEPYELEKPDFDGSDAYDFWHLVNRQDWSICERVQLGMSARVHQHGMFSPMEDSNLDIRKYVTDRIGDYVVTE